MPWYRRPEEDEVPPDVERGRGRGRPRGRARGRGRGRVPPEPRGASPDSALPPHMYVMGPHGPYVPYPYYHNPSRMEEMLPHWQFVFRAQQESHRTQNPATLGHARRRDAQAGPTPYGNYEAAANREHFNPGGNMDSPFATQQGGLDQSPGFHYPVFSHPTYAGYTNQIPTPQKGHQQQVDNRTNRRGESSNDRRASTVRTEASQKRTNSRVSNRVSSLAPNVQDNGDPTHHMTDLVATFGARPPAPKTLDETAAFLNHPQPVFQKNKILNSSIAAHPLHATREALSQTSIVTRDQVRAAALHPVQLLLAQEQVQALSAIDTINAMHDDRATSSQIPDFRKYSELSVTIAKVEPPQAYQASVAKNLDLLTPPLAHQAPVTHTPAQPQSARLHAVTSPPPAHQISTTHSIDLMHPRHLKEQTYANPFCPQARQLSIVKTTADNILTASHATYDRTLRKAEFIYEPSTETLTAENVMYRPEKDLITKERVVYQRNNLKFAKTEIRCKDIVASAETVYESDKVTARKTVIQHPAVAMETAKEQNVTSAFNSMQYSQPNILTAAAALCRQQAEIIAAAQTRAQALVEAEQRSQSDAIAQMIAAQQIRAKALVEAEQRSQSNVLEQMIAAEQTCNKALVEAERRSRSETYAQIIAAEHIRANALVEAEQRSQSDAIAQMIAAQQIRAKALVEAEQRSQSDAIAQMIAAQQIRAKALVEAEQRSQSNVLEQMIAAEQTCNKALVEAERRSRSETYAQIIAAEHIRANALVEAAQRSQSDAIAQIIAAQQIRAKALVEAEQRSQSNVLAQMFAAEQTQANSLVEAAQRSQSDAIAQMIAAEQTRAKAVFEAEHRSQSDSRAERQSIFQSTVEAKARHQRAYLRDTKVHAESLRTTPNLRDISSNEHEQDESSEESRNVKMIQWLMHCNALNNSSDSVTPSQTLRQTRKRKKSPTQPSREARTRQAQPTTSSSSSRAAAPAPDLQAIIALNRSLQSLPASLQVIPRYTELLTNNGNTTDASDDDDHLNYV